jgi:hypothetical protein
MSGGVERGWRLKPRAKGGLAGHREACLRRLGTPAVS